LTNSAGKGGPDSGIPIPKELIEYVIRHIEEKGELIDIKSRRQFVLVIAGILIERMKKLPAEKMEKIIRTYDVISAKENLDLSQLKDDVRIVSQLGLTSRAAIVIAAIREYLKNNDPEFVEITKLLTITPDEIRAFIHRKKTEKRRLNF